MAKPKQGNEREREEEKSRKEMEAEGASHMEKSVRTHRRDLLSLLSM